MKTLTELRRERRRAYNAAHSAAYKYGPGIRGFFNILKKPFSFFGFFLGIALTAVGLYKNMPVIPTVATGASIVYFSIMHKVISFPNALMSGILIFFGGSVADSMLTVFSEDPSEADIRFAVSTAAAYAILVFLFVFGLILRYRVKIRPAPAPFMLDRDFCIVDVIAYEMLPIKGLPALRKLVYAVPENSGFAYRRAFSIADKLGFVLASLLLSEDGTKVTMYLFTPPDADISAIETAAFGQAEKVGEETFTDEATEILTREAYPSDKELFRSYNRMMTAELRSRKIDETEEHTVEYVVSFVDKNDMADFIAEAKNEGLELSEKSLKKADEPFEVGGKNYFAVAVGHRTRLGEERIERNTDDLIGLSSRFNGKLRSWNVID